MSKTISKYKAKKILKHGKVHGKVLTARQRRFFGSRASGRPVRRRAGRKG